MAGPGVPRATRRARGETFVQIWLTTAEIRLLGELAPGLGPSTALRSLLESRIRGKLDPVLENAPAPADPSQTEGITAVSGVEKTVDAPTNPISVATKPTPPDPFAKDREYARRAIRVTR